MLHRTSGLTKVIAEGVETPEQLALLCAARCAEMQGYLVSPAPEPGRFAQLLHSRERWT
jgi:EAL domain-containing protein (putative c-di-GMP-specific phosphodiesterase class I)